MSLTELGKRVNDSRKLRLPCASQSLGVHQIGPWTAWVFWCSRASPSSTSGSWAACNPTLSPLVMVSNCLNQRARVNSGESLALEELVAHQVRTVIGYQVPESRLLPGRRVRWWPILRFAHAL